MSRSSKSNLLFVVSQYILYIFWPNPSFGSRDRAWKQNFGDLGNKDKVTKSNKLFSLSNVSMQVWSKSTHWFGRQGAEVQKRLIFTVFIGR